MWPLQKDCDSFYGNPRGKDPTLPDPKWEAANLVLVKAPFQMTYDGKPIKGIRVHTKCADSLQRVLSAIWDEADHKQAIVDAWGVSIFGGSYNYRLMRNGKALSMHSYGAAIDLDPSKNPYNSKKFKFTANGPVVKLFEQEGWEWGGRWSSPDAMHFQAARVG